jgi:GNAT superfamily N-acetyltransferase
MGLRPPWFIWGGSSPPDPPKSAAARAEHGGWPIRTPAVEVREARTAAEVEAAGRVTVAANAEFAPADPAARGRGIGQALLRACLERARAAGKRRMALHTTEWMVGARAMYERAGFVREPEGDAELPGVTIIAYAAEL